MSEYFKQLVRKEEEFLEDYPGVASAATELLDGDWEPNPGCDDAARRNQDYFIGRGELPGLVFDAAAVYHDAAGFSSVQIVLKSSTRTVTVRVKRAGQGFNAEKIVDKPSQD